MGRPAEPKPVKLICSIIYREQKDLDKAQEYLLSSFGRAEPLEKVLAFDYTEYYREEMGWPLARKLICFRDLVPLDDAHKIKLRTNSIEALLSSAGRRRVNIDPGYLTEAKLVLFTTKDHAHRIYTGDRIFAEITLFFRNGIFRPWPWTYPDYASKPMREYFQAVREIYTTDIKS